MNQEENRLYRKIKDDIFTLAAERLVRKELANRVSDR